MDVRAWRARVLEWSGNWRKRNRNTCGILRVSKTDPDNWLGLARVYLGEGKTQDALRALDFAVELDPARADVHMARGRALAAAGDPKSAQLEFQRALRLDPANDEARVAQRSVFGAPKNELRFGQEDNLFNFTGANYDEWLSLRTQWGPHWIYRISGEFFSMGHGGCRKVCGQCQAGSQWGALTSWEARPRTIAECFRETKLSSSSITAGKPARRALCAGSNSLTASIGIGIKAPKILALTSVTLVYLPREWTFSMGVTEARSAFPGIGTQWRPSEIARLGFPIMRREEKQLSGNVFFATVQGFREHRSNRTC